MHNFSFIFLQDAATVQAVADSLESRAASTKALLEGKTTGETLQTLVDTSIQFGLKLLIALAVFTIGGWLISLVRKALYKNMVKHKKDDTTLVSFIDSLITILMWVMLIVLVVGGLGVNTTSVAALLAAGGMAIGMALSGTLQNFAGGVILLLFKPFKAGNIIEAQGYSGRVKTMNIVSTTLITRDNKNVIIPNGILSNGNITNFSAQPVRRLEWTFNVPYGTPSDQVEEEVLKIMKADSRLLDASSPNAEDPFVGLSAMKDSSVEFIARAWAQTDDYWPVYFDINKAIYDTLPEKGISFPFPQMDVHIKNQ